MTHIFDYTWRAGHAMAAAASVELKVRSAFEFDGWSLARSTITGAVRVQGKASDFVG